MLFTAVCAYVGAALYPRLSPKESTAAMAERVSACVRLEGIALREELSLSLPDDPALFARDGERLSGDRVLAATTGTEDSGSGSALFLAFSDGLEQLSPADALPLSVDRVRSLMAAVPGQQEGDGRLVLGFDWYYAALSDYSGALPQGRCSLRFDGFDGAVTGRLVEVSGYENGERALLFRLMTGDTDYLKLRNCRAELILPGG